MPKLLEKILLLALDFFALSGAFLTWGWLRRELGFFAEADLLVFFSISLIVNLFWIFLLSPSKARMTSCVPLFCTICSISSTLPNNGMFL